MYNKGKWLKHLDIINNYGSYLINFIMIEFVYRNFYSKINYTFIVSKKNSSRHLLLLCLYMKE